MKQLSPEAKLIVEYKLNQLSKDLYAHARILKWNPKRNKEMREAAYYIKNLSKGD